MSLRARTSVLDEWWRLKVTGNEWVWASVMLTGYLWVASYIWVWCIVVLARHSVCNLLSETDFASAALLQVLVRTLCLPVTSVLILVRLLRQLPVFLWNSVNRSDHTREPQTWRLQHEVADCNPENLTLVVFHNYPAHLHFHSTLDLSGRELQSAHRIDDLWASGQRA